MLSRKKLTPYLFLTPFLILFIVFVIYPIFNSLYLSFHETSAKNNVFIGLTNYKNVLTDKVFWKSLLNVLFILLFQVPIMLMLSTILANLLNSEIKFKSLFRLFIFLPVLIDLVTYSIVFSIFFNEQFGLINYLLELIHIGPIKWLTGAWGAKFLIIIAVTWRWTGYNTIILLSGLQSINKGLYEAAEIEGANSIDKFLKITVPLLKPILLFCAIISTIGTIQLFTEPSILTAGGPNRETYTPIMYLYNYGFNTFKFGYASAVAYIITVIVFIFSLIQIKISKDGGN